MPSGSTRQCLGGSSSQRRLIPLEVGEFAGNIALASKSADVGHQEVSNDIAEAGLDRPRPTNHQAGWSGSRIPEARPTVASSQTAGIAASGGESLIWTAFSAVDGHVTEHDVREWPVAALAIADATTPARVSDQ
jgi:hypothetical protein